MKRQVLLLDDLQTWLKEIEILYARDDSRSLFLIAGGGFKVEVKGEKAFYTLKEKEAIDYYNEH